MRLLGAVARSADRADGTEGGRRYRHRGAEIHCNEAGAVCRQQMDGRPFDGMHPGAANTITPLVDLWVTEKRLPHWLKAVPKKGR